MKTVVILGAGNVAHHLVRAFVNNTIHVRQIFNRTLEKAEKIGESYKIPYTDKISELIKADIYIITSSDSYVEELSHYIPYDDCLVVHTSGSLPISQLKGSYRKGVLYPLQTFTKDRVLKYREIPFFVEAEQESDLKDLKDLCLRVSGQVHVVDYETRLKLQMAGVLVCNFTNHLYEWGQEVCKESSIGFDVLRPLIQETAHKIGDIMPYDAQTGPARRGDQIVIDKHLAIIDDPRKKEIYKLMSESLMKTYGKL